MKMKITQYGRSIKAGGWDAYGDPQTDQGLGNSGQVMSYRACALTEVARTALGITKDQHRNLKITFEDGSHQYRKDEDTAPEDEPRCDLLMFWCFDPTIPETAEVTVI